MIFSPSVVFTRARFTKSYVAGSYLDVKTISFAKFRLARARDLGLGGVCHERIRRVYVVTVCAYVHVAGQTSRSSLVNIIQGVTGFGRNPSQSFSGSY